MTCVEHALQTLSWGHLLIFFGKQTAGRACAKNSWNMKRDHAILEEQCENDVVGFKYWLDHVIDSPWACVVLLICMEVGRRSWR
jgi:hypothetical protein